MRTIDLQQFLSQVDELLTNLCFRMLRINHDHPMNKFVHSFLLKVRSASKTLETNSADLIGHHLNQAFAFCHNKTNKTMQIYRVCAIILTNSLDRIYLRELESWDCQVHFVGLKLPLTRNRICHELTLQFSNPDHDAFIIVHQGPANPKNGNWFLESRDDSLENDKRNGNLQSEFSLDALWTTYVHAMPTLCVKPINVIIDSCGSGAWVEQAKTMSLPINVIVSYYNNKTLLFFLIQRCNGTSGNFYVLSGCQASCRRYFDFDDCGHFLRLFFRLCWPQSRNHPSCFPGVSMYNHLTREIIRPEPDEYLQLHHLWVSSLRAQSLTTAHTPWILCGTYVRTLAVLCAYLISARL
jgi:hypothetical protein